MAFLNLLVAVPKSVLLSTLKGLFRPELKSALLRVLRRAVVVGLAAFLGDLASGLEALGLEGTEQLIVAVVVAALAGAVDKVTRELKRG